MLLFNWLGSLEAEKQSTYFLSERYKTTELIKNDLKGIAVKVLSMI